MAVALTPFQALCGFRSLEDIQYNLEYFYEVNELLSDESKCNLIRVFSLLTYILILTYISLSLAINLYSVMCKHIMYVYACTVLLRSLTYTSICY